MGEPRHLVDLRPELQQRDASGTPQLLGSWGAILADLAMQSLGLAAIMLFLPLAAWGWHLALRTVPERRRARLLAVAAVRHAACRGAVRSAPAEELATA